MCQIVDIGLKFHERPSVGIGTGMVAISFRILIGIPLGLSFGERLGKDLGLLI